MKFSEILKNVRTKSPLIHNITNYVTVNDCANIQLACGASPIMADAAEEAADITKICNGLNINVGTLNSDTIKSMFISGAKANELNIPILLDPVGIGASPLRTETCLSLTEKIKFSVIRGNISEIKTIAGVGGKTKGVDADIADTVNDDKSLNSAIAVAKTFAKKNGAIIAVTGAVDIITDGIKTFLIYNGHEIMSRITGSGCQLSALTTAFVAANPEDMLSAVAAAVSAMGLCGEIAFERMSEKDGNSSYRNYIIDAVYNLDETTLERGAKYEIR